MATYAMTGRRGMPSVADFHAINMLSQLFVSVWLEQANRPWPRRVKEPPQTPHNTSPESRDLARWVRCSPLLALRIASIGPAYWIAMLSCRALALLHKASSTMRSSGTSVTINSEAGLMRDTRLPVLGSLT